MTICPEIAVADELKARSLAALKWNRPDYQVPILMLWHSEKWCSPLLTNFMAQAHKVMT